MEPTEKGRCSEAGDWKLAKCKSYSAGSNQFADLRWKLSGYDVIDPKNRVEKSGFRDFESAKETWRRVEQILFSERFQNLVYDKLKLPEGWRDKMITGNVPTDFRLQTDKMGENGYAIGVHPDTPKKLATMQFYFPGLHGGDEKKQESKYGTCVHTAANSKRETGRTTTPHLAKRSLVFDTTACMLLKCTKRVITASKRL